MEYYSNKLGDSHEKMWKGITPPGFESSFSFKFWILSTKHALLTIC